MTLSSVRVHLGVRCYYVIINTVSPSRHTGWPHFTSFQTSFLSALPTIHSDVLPRCFCLVIQLMTCFNTVCMSVMNHGITGLLLPSSICVALLWLVRKCTAWRKKKTVQWTLSSTLHPSQLLPVSRCNSLSVEEGYSCVYNMGCVAARVQSVDSYYYHVKLTILTNFDLVPPSEVM